MIAIIIATINPQSLPSSSLLPLLSLACNQHLSQPELVSIARDKTKAINALERKLWLARRNLMRQSARNRSLKEELEQKALRGDV